MLSDRDLIAIAIFLTAFQALVDGVTRFQMENPSGWDTAFGVIGIVTSVFWFAFGFAVSKKLDPDFKVWE